MKKLFFMLAVAMMSVALNAQGAEVKEQEAVKTTTFQTDIDCPSCSKKIMNVMPFKKGVKKVDIDLNTQTVCISYDPSKNSDEELIKNLKKLDVKAEVAKPILKN